ncbi:TIGR02186 family protein [Candidatus Woesearchaeota archaeon]|nr:TIGR02186 family protein [Candidatus Woesearchaeota archaeon]
MVDTLLKYVEEQLGKGYRPHAVKENLVRKGYSPALVDNVLESVMMKKNTSGPAPTQGVSHAKHLSSKTILVLSFIIIVILGIVFIPKLVKTKEPLLDITASPDKHNYYQGEKLGFEVEIYNMGSSERFDTTLRYRLLDKNDNMIISREETIAISTSTSHYKTIDLPGNIKPGTYTLKVYANYEGRVATSSFTFDIEEKTATIKETCSDGVRNQDEVGVDCGGVCGGYWYDNACHSTPKQVTPSEEETCSDGIKNQDEVGVDCGGVCEGYWYDGSCHSSPKPKPPEEQSFAEKMMQARALAKTNPEQAKNICLSLKNSDDKDKCLKTIASLSMKKEYCELITGTEDRDICYYPFFMQGDYSVCEKLTDPENKEACEQLRDISELAKQLNYTTTT